MICPNCKDHLTKVWQAQRHGNAPAIPQAQWSCSTCGQSFTREQLRPVAKGQAKADPAPTPAI
jgi:hypothetical protein